MFKKVENPFLAIQNPEKTLSSSLFSHASGGLFKAAAENPFLPLKKTEDKAIAQSTSSLFSSSGNSLFSSSSSSKPSFSFQKLAPKEINREDEQHSSLFSLTKKSSLFAQHPGLDPANLLSSNAPEKTFLKVFTTTEDPTKRKAFLFLNKFESDVLFKVEGQEFPAHKYILSEKCKLFKNMFSSGMLESYSSVITIPETKASIFKAFLEYVYLGQTVLNEEMALNLMDLSERYIIGDLKAFCANCLHNYLSVDNCVRIFESACLYDAPSLKQKTLFFFQINCKRILEKHNLQDLPKMSHVYLWKIYSKYNPILGPPLSDLVVNQAFPSQSSFL